MDSDITDNCLFLDTYEFQMNLNYSVTNIKDGSRSDSDLIIQWVTMNMDPRWIQTLIVQWVTMNMDPIWIQIIDGF